jgi:hypothetical protein
MHVSYCFVAKCRNCDFEIDWPSKEEDAIDQAKDHVQEEGNYGHEIVVTQAIVVRN